MFERLPPERILVLETISASDLVARVCGVVYVAASLQTSSTIPRHFIFNFSVFFNFSFGFVVVEIFLGKIEILFGFQISIGCNDFGVIENSNCLDFQAIWVNLIVHLAMANITRVFPADPCDVSSRHISFLF